MRADDDTYMLHVLRRGLESEFGDRVRVLVTDGAHAALEIVATTTIHLVITDYFMPEMGGREIVASLKLSGLLPKLPVIVMSGDLDQETAVRLKATGVREVLQKPFEPARLHEAVSAGLEQARLHRGAGNGDAAPG